jgi:hypothetical protein
VERYIFLLSNGTSFVNFDAILRKLQLFSDGRLDGKKLYSAILNIIEFKDQLKFRYQVRPLWFISAIATTVGLLDVAVPIMHFAAYLEIIY